MEARSIKQRLVRLLHNLLERQIDCDSPLCGKLLEADKLKVWIVVAGFLDQRNGLAERVQMRLHTPVCSLS